MRLLCFAILLTGFLGGAAVVAAGTMAAAARAGAVAEAHFSLVEDSAAGTITIRDGRTPVLTYRYGEELTPGADPKYTQSCYVHPLYSLDGVVLTDDFPADHLHHHGLFWVWPVVGTRGVATSTWEPLLPRLRQYFGRWLTRETVNASFLLSVENEWKLEGKETVAREKVTFRVHPADELGRAIDFELVIEAVGGPLELQGTPAENKGYGGLCFRGAPAFTGAAMTTNEGELKEDAVNTPFRWADLSAADSGVAIFVPPDHPGYPTKWLIRNSYAGVMNVSWPGLEPVVLRPGEPVTLRYRIYVHRSDAGAAEVGAAYMAYTKGDS